MCSRGTNGVVPLLLGLLALAGCSAPEPDAHDPESVALRLFALPAAASTVDPLAAVFDPLQLSGGRADLLDALDGLAAPATPTVLGMQTAPEGAEAFVDLEVELPGSGRAVYNVKLRRLGEQGWRIAWFQGPGVEWPTRNPTGPSLSTSAPPQPPSDDW